MAEKLTQIVEKMGKQKCQRIKMKLYKHPVKLDGTITDFSLDGSTFTVEFDGPYPTTTFWRYSENTAADKEPMKFDSGGFGMSAGAQLWEIL